MSSRGDTLRERRRALGLSLEDLSRRTRIPLAHLRAIEEGREAELPSGPYASAYLRTLEEELDIVLEHTEELPADAPPPGLPLWAVRLVALGAVVALLVLIGWQAWERAAPEVAALAPEAATPIPDQHVRIVARRNTRLTVTVDDELVLDRKVAGGEDLEFTAHDRVQVEIASADSARIEYNGRTIVPQGRQDAPRRLVFIDDLQEGP